MLYTQYGSLDDTQSLKGSESVYQWLLLGNRPHPPATTSGESATPLDGQFVYSGIRGNKEEFLPGNDPQIHGSNIPGVIGVELWIT